MKIESCNVTILRTINFYSLGRVPNIRFSVHRKQFHVRKYLVRKYRVITFCGIQ